jgi:hypothetical protein
LLHARDIAGCDRVDNGARLEEKSLRHHEERFSGSGVAGGSALLLSEVLVGASGGSRDASSMARTCSIQRLA